MRIILAMFTDRLEVYGSLKPFFEQYPQYAELKDKWVVFSTAIACYKENRNYIGTEKLLQ